MPAKAEVILRYGPYSAVGLAVEHRTFRLEGLQAVLAKGGHKVVLEKIEEWNVVELMVNEDVVFQCTITDLEFGCSLLCHKVCICSQGGGEGPWKTNVGSEDLLEGGQEQGDFLEPGAKLRVHRPTTSIQRKVL
ncbi:hypothetical protein GW7_11363 [Heterocephalus glaber]|uniref:Uncharacterized protein n=1 Tax=Heterocephalus glaber TaxID=10181 RepID=G5B0X1_HETGA|nr:hypothetical protein GW7_11363 [Heterocephalus glaber]